MQKFDYHIFTLAVIASLGLCGLASSASTEPATTTPGGDVFTTTAAPNETTTVPGLETTTAAGVTQYCADKFGNCIAYNDKMVAEALGYSYTICSPLYCKCVDGLYVDQYCDVGLVFSSIENGCILTEFSSDCTGESEIECYTMCPTYSEEGCGEPGDVTASYDCSSVYCVCQDTGKYHAETCAPGLVFNPDSGMCDNVDSTPVCDDGGDPTHSHSCFDCEQGCY